MQRTYHKSSVAVSVNLNRWNGVYNTCTGASILYVLKIKHGSYAFGSY